MSGLNRHTALMSLAILFVATGQSIGQETVFGLFRNDLKLAEQYLSEHRFDDALAIYLEEASKAPSGAFSIKVARCYYALREYGAAVRWYEKSSAAGILEAADIFNMAEAYASMKNYEKAVEWYRAYLQKKPDDQFVIKKIWQLQNIHYLYEDSLHYVVRGISANSGAGELCATPFQNGLVFLTNRRQVSVVENLDATSGRPFYKLYQAMLFPDTINHAGFIYGNPTAFRKPFESKFHEGPVRFYNNERNMVFVAIGADAGENGCSRLQLFFADYKKGKWRNSQPFPYNSVHYSISDPAISEDGKTLYFSSDMEGGFGGKDLYKSELVDGRWTRPVNLGDQINTPYDEVFPYLHHNNTLYFSSNGHAGMGGLDIFKTTVTSFSFGDVINLGYPMNSHGDEFGIVMDSLSTHGFITSNRVNSGLNDDIFEFDMDVQTYPLVISGLLRFKQFSWSDSSTLKPLANAKLFLVDNLRNVLVYENESDSSGNFSLEVPYFSQYKIRVVGQDNEENIVSLEIPKHRKAEGRHEIVVVKDPFKQQHAEILR